MSQEVPVCSASGYGNTICILRLLCLLMSPPPRAASAMPCHVGPQEASPNLPGSQVSSVAAVSPAIQSSVNQNGRLTIDGALTQSTPLSSLPFGSPASVAVEGGTPATGNVPMASPGGDLPSAGMTAFPGFSFTPVAAPSPPPAPSTENTATVDGILVAQSHGHVPAPLYFASPALPLSQSGVPVPSASVTPSSGLTPMVLHASTPFQLSPVPPPLETLAHLEGPTPTAELPASFDASLPSPHPVLDGQATMAAPSPSPKRATPPPSPKQAKAMPPSPSPKRATPLPSPNQATAMAPPPSPKRATPPPSPKQAKAIAPPPSPKRAIPPPSPKQGTATAPPLSPEDCHAAPSESTRAVSKSPFRSATPSSALLHGSSACPLPVSPLRAGSAPAPAAAPSPRAHQPASRDALGALQSAPLPPSASVSNPMCATVAVAAEGCTADQQAQPVSPALGLVAGAPPAQPPSESVAPPLPSSPPAASEFSVVAQADQTPLPASMPHASPRPSRGERGGHLGGDGGIIL